MNEEASLQWIVDYLEEHLVQGGTGWFYNGKTICAKAFSFLHGYSITKMYKARQLVANGAIVPFGLNKQKINRGPKKLGVMAWIGVYCEFFGDHRPDKNEIHLPCNMT
jgi:hypothetical protein